jgi:membrane AbrB-like protein
VASPRLTARQVGLWAATLALAAAGGFAAHLIGIPLAWMIGAMVAVAGAGIAGAKPAAPSQFRPAALIVLGTGFGQAFTPPVLAALAESLPALVLAGFASVLSGVVVSRVTARVGGLDTRTAFFISVPGGIIAMVVLAARAGASVPAVTLGQTLRMVLVVLTYPVAMAAFGTPGQDVFSFTPPPVAWPMLPVLFALTVAGAFLMNRTGLANPWMMGPVFVSLGLAVAGTPLSGLPGPLIDAAQVAMGATLGTRLTREFLFRSHRLLMASVVNMLLLSLCAAVIAAACVALARLPLQATLLGTAPGGMPEMAITAKVMNLGVPLVLGFHLVRLLICNLFVPPLYRAYAWAERKLGRSAGE